MVTWRLFMVNLFVSQYFLVSRFYRKCRLCGEIVKSCNLRNILNKIVKKSIHALTFLLLKKYYLTKLCLSRRNINSNTICLILVMHEIHSLSFAMHADKVFFFSVFVFLAVCTCIILKKSGFLSNQLNLITQILPIYTFLVNYFSLAWYHCSSLASHASNYLKKKNSKKFLLILQYMII